jgi:hypothetical protein
MTPQALKRLYFFGAGLAFVLSYSVADIASRVIVARQNLIYAIGGHLREALLQPVATVLLAAPFGCLAWLSYRLGCRKAPKRGLVLLIIPSFVLAYFYFSGLFAAKEAMLKKMWTAAALSVGLLPFFIGVPVVTCAVIAYFLIRPRTSASNDES